ncbi:MAG: GHKL domain-containing protein [Lachnospiraceae bacterium]|nr:GHKL domain-containing protein [Lachnospiraceae bacterium]
MEQMDIYYELASVVFSITVILATAYLIVWFMRPFLNNSRCAWEAGAVYFVVMLVIYCIPYEILGMIPDAAALLAVFVVLYVREKGDRYGQNIFLLLIVYLIKWFAHGILLPFREVLYQEILFSSFILRQSELVYFGLYLIIEIVYFVLRFVLMYYLAYMMERAYIYKKEAMGKGELGLLLAAPLSIMAGNLAFTFFFETYLADMNRYIQDIHREYNWIKALYQLVSFGAIFSVVVFSQKIKESHKQEKEGAVLKEQMESMKRYLSEVETLYQDIRRLKHDMGNHVVILENLFQKDLHQEAMGYLQKLEAEFHETAAELKTGNPITDVIVMEKAKEAARKGIAFYHDFHFPEGNAIDVFDISVILSNALNNAIEGAASCQDPYIKVSSYHKKNVYMIEFRNNFNGKLIFSEKDRLPVTSKEDQKEHGYGLSSIRKVTRKYFGDMEVEQNGKEFVLYVMLMSCVMSS